MPDKENVIPAKKCYSGKQEFEILPERRVLQTLDRNKNLKV